MRELRLPNFLEDALLNELRERMRAPLVDYSPQISSEGRISKRDLERLATTGITVGADEVEIQSDGTFTYQGIPVLLYILDVSMYHSARTARLPRFHVCNCRTWNDMKARGRQDRYVASTRVDGLFELNLTMPSGQIERRTERLSVCQNCLDHLSWKGFTIDDPRTKRLDAVHTFSLEEFFQEKGRPMVRERPRWTPETYPSSYTDDFDDISSRLRAAAEWRCQGPCGRLFAGIWQRRFLHVHHLNGVKGDNSPENLRVYCLGCHANEPSHEHMKRTPDYLHFVRLFGERGRSER